MSALFHSCFPLVHKVVTGRQAPHPFLSKDTVFTMQFNVSVDCADAAYAGARAYSTPTHAVHTER